MRTAAQAHTSSKAASFSVTETLRDGRPVEIRALRPTDLEDLKAAVAIAVLELDERSATLAIARSCPEDENGPVLQLLHRRQLA